MIRPLRRPSPLLVHAVMAFVALLFSINYVVSKFGLNTFNPLTFAYLRVLGAAVVLNLAVRERGPAPLRPGDARRLILYSILGVVINQSMFLGGLALTSAHIAAILITTIPIFALVAGILIGRERATPAKAAGIALAFAGALVVVGGEGFEGATKSLAGDLMIIINSLSYALYLVASKPIMARVSARRVVSWMFGAGAILMLPLAAIPMLHEEWSLIGRGAWLSLAFVIIGPTVGAYLLNAWALRYVDSSIVAAYTYLQPVGATILAAIFLHERIRAAALVAGLMIIGGVALSSRREGPGPPPRDRERDPVRRESPPASV